MREAEFAIAERINWARTIDGFTIDLHPLADLLHAEQGRVGQVAIGIGTYIKEEVAALGHNVAQQMDELVSALVGVGGDIRP